jgi:hypothetical protein
MQQIKFFKGIEADVAAIEREINAWLKASGARVVHIFGNIAPQSLRTEAANANLLNPSKASGRSFDSSDLFVAVVYETK